MVQGRQHLAPLCSAVRAARVANVPEEPLASAPVAIAIAGWVRRRCANNRIEQDAGSPSVEERFGAVRQIRPLGFFTAGVFAPTPERVQLREGPSE